MWSGVGGLWASTNQQVMAAHQISPGSIMKFAHTKNECRCACFLILLWPWMKVKVIHIGIKVNSLVVSIIKSHWKETGLQVSEYKKSWKVGCVSLSLSLSPYVCVCVCVCVRVRVCVYVLQSHQSWILSFEYSSDEIKWVFGSSNQQVSTVCPHPSNSIINFRR